MTDEMPTDRPGTGKPSASHEALRSETLNAELERRFEIFENIDDDDFGRFTGTDWAICTVAFFLLPIVIAWWAL
jgi:hypothetical protein